MISRTHGPLGPPDAPVRRRRRSALRRRLGSEAGFTLNELLLAMVLAVIVVGAPMTFIIVSINQQNSASSRSVAAREAQVGLAQLTHDLRQAQYITDSSGVDTTPVAISSSATAATASLYLPTSGGSVAGTRVVWTCTVGATCTRQLGTGSAVPEINGVTAATFTGAATGGTAATANPAYVSINIQVQVTSLLDKAGTHVVAGLTNPIVLQDGVALRNYS